jgi:hypothetical protein
MGREDPSLDVQSSLCSAPHRCLNVAEHWPQTLFMKLEVEFLSKKCNGLQILPAVSSHGLTVAD